MSIFKVGRTGVITRRNMGEHPPWPCRQRTVGAVLLTSPFRARRWAVWVWHPLSSHPEGVCQTVPGALQDATSRHARAVGLARATAAANGGDVPSRLTACAGASARACVAVVAPGDALHDNVRRVVGDGPPSGHEFTSGRSTVSDRARTCQQPPAARALCLSGAAAQRRLTAVAHAPFPSPSRCATSPTRVCGRSGHAGES